MLFCIFIYLFIYPRYMAIQSFTVTYMLVHKQQLLDTSVVQYCNNDLQFVMAV